jgi:hypothetical protein
MSPAHTEDGPYLRTTLAVILSHYSPNGLKLKARRGEIRAIVKPNGQWVFHEADCRRLGERGRVVSATSSVIGA